MRYSASLIAVALLVVSINSERHEEDIIPISTGENLIDSPGLLLLANPTTALVDIIAVHGMDGNWKRSWTANNGAFWLQDFLPEFVPNARIYSFSYDSRRKADEPLPFDIADHGRALVSLLSVERQLTNTTKRPILFIGHSLGGIVIKTALVYADNTRSGHLEHHEAIQLCTRAVVYMGTPHQGSGNIDLLRMIASIMEPLSHKNARLLEHLRPHSQFLEQLQENYLAISSAFETRFFYELLDTTVGPGIKLMLVPRYSAVIPGAINSEAIPLRKDHITLVKYPHISDASMQRVGRELSILALHASEKPQADPVHIPTHHLHQNEPLPKPSFPTSTSLEFRLGLTVSKRRNSQFTGRNSTLSQISENFLLFPKKQCNILVLFGMGGIGKTQLALEYSHLACESFSSIFWVDGSSKQTAIRSIRGILERIENHYRQLGLDMENPRFVSIQDALHPPENSNRFKVGAELDTSQILVDTLRDWLSYPQNQEWLLVLDNIDDLESFDFNQILPIHGGSVLMTSRRPDLTVKLPSIEVTEMDEAEALQLLVTTGDVRIETESDRLSAKQLNAFLGYFPLAITQAGSYLNVNKVSFRSYLDLLKEHPMQVLSHRLAGFAWNYRNDTVLTTWEISYMAIRRQSPHAIPILHLCGFLAREAIDVEILKFWSEQRDLENMVDSERTDIGHAINLLLSYSFLRRTENTMTMHPLVHLWARERLRDADKENFARKVLETLYKFVDSQPPSYYGLWHHINAISNFYLTHNVCSKRPEDFLDLSVRVPDSSLLSRLQQSIEYFYGWYLLSTGKLSEWSKYAYRQWTNTMIEGLTDWELLARLSAHEGDESSVLSWALCRAMQSLPSKDIRVLVMLGNYANSLYDDEEQLEWYTWLYHARKQVLGKDHSATMGAMLGMGRFSPECDDGIKYLQIAVETRERTEGIEDSLTQNAMRHLQELYRACSEHRTCVEAAVQWNLKAFNRLIKTWQTEKALQLLRVDDSIILEMAQSALQTSPNTSLALVVASLSESRLPGYKYMPGHTGLASSVVFILDNYNALVRNLDVQTQLSTLIEARWNEFALFFKSRSDTDQGSLSKKTFSTCLHTRMALLMAIMISSNGDEITARGWLEKLVYPESGGLPGSSHVRSIRPKEQVEYSKAFCGDHATDAPEPSSLTHSMALWADLTDLVGQIHESKRQAETLSSRLVLSVATELAMNGTYNEDDVASSWDDDNAKFSQALHLKNYRAACFNDWEQISDITYDFWKSKSHLCPGASLIPKMAIKGKQDMSGSCFTDTRQFYMCALST